MALPRLPAAEKPFTVELTVNERLRPYFEIWYQRTRKAGENPHSFIIRMLKTAALNSHLADTSQAEVDSIEAAKQAALEALQDDAELMQTELD